MAFKMAGSSYKKGNTKTKATLLQTEKQKKNLPPVVVAAIAKKSPLEQKEKSTTKAGGRFTHPSGVSDAQVAANKKAGMVYYADRGKWMYPEKSGK